MSKKEAAITTAKVVLVNQQYPGKILVLHREAGSDIPGGKITPKETLLAGLEREVGEEIGKVKLHDIRWLAQQSRRIGKHAVRAYHVFAARVELPEEGLQLSREHQAYSWVPLSEFKHLDIGQRYKDAVKLGRSVIQRLLPEPAEPSPSVNEEPFGDIEPHPDYDAFMEYQEPGHETTRA